MAKSKGILLNPETNDFDIRVVRNSVGKIAQGLQVGDVNNQNIGIILKMQQGELKGYPIVGVGIDNMTLDHDYLQYKHKIRHQLSAEGMQVKHLEINGKNIEIDASYK